MRSHYNNLKRKIVNKEINSFDNFILILVGVSALCIGIETNRDLVARHPKVFEFIELFFVCFFSIEIIIRLGFYMPNWKNYFKDNWNLFDFVIVLITVIPYILPETIAQDAISTIRILRLARVFRIFRFISILKPLQLLVSTLASSIPSISYVGVLIAILFYVYGVVGVFQFGLTVPEHFDSLPSAFLALFQVLTLESWPDILGSALEQGHGTFAILYFVSFIIISSLIILNLIIGVIISEIETFKEVDARGTDRIYCSNHTVILGWSEKMASLLQELVTSDPTGSKIISILSPKTKTFVKEYLRNHKVNLNGTKVICRNGSPDSSTDLEIVNPENASSIIIMRKDGLYNDSYAFKVLTILSKKIKLSKVKVILPLLRKYNEDALGFYNSPNIYSAPVNDITARMIAQGTRQPGLTDIYEELLTFDKSNLIITDGSQFHGSLVSQIARELTSSYLIGLVGADGSPKLNVSPDHKVTNEQILSVGAVETKKVSNWTNDRPSHTKMSRSSNADFEIIPERICIIGHNRLSKLIITELDSYMAFGSSIDVYYDPNLSDKNLDPTEYETKSKLNFYPLQTDSKSSIESLNIERYDYFLILSYLDRMTTDSSDMLSYITWNYLRDRLNNASPSKSILIQMSSASEEITKRTESSYDRFITIDKVESYLLAHFSQKPAVKAIFEELFDESGSEIYIKSASEYLEIGKRYDLDELLRCFEIKNVAFIGHRTYDKLQNMYRDVELNPSKNTEFRYDNKDKVVIVARVQYDEMESSATAS